MFSVWRRTARTAVRKCDVNCDRQRNKRLDLFSVIAVVFVVCLAQLTMVTANIMGDECDWFGSGLSSTDSGRSVTPVYLRCAQGQVTWVYPRGALRVLLRLGASGRDFRGCLKVDPDFGGARVFLEGARSLSLLHGGGGDDDAAAPKQLARCFQSRRGQVALYVEATRSGSDYTEKEAAAFTYDLEALPRDGSGYDPADECRPCSTEEMARAYCTSDLVTRGIITSIENQDDLQVARVTIKVTKLLRHSTDDNAVEGVDATNLVDEPNSQCGELTVYRARRCGAKHGPGEYVFMARRKLGDLALTCAPTLEDWAEIKRLVNKDGNAHCKLES